jgi:hypothetical protein
MTKVNNAVAITGGNHKGDRHVDDFYPTTPECVYSFLALERDHLKGMKILEPCCGDGAISKILIQEGFEVESADLFDRGYGEVGKDFLWTMETSCQALITNPPFKLAEAFIYHALEVLEVEYMAMLLKSQYWHAKGRSALFAKHPPAVVYPMTWRPDFLGKGSPTMDCQWTVWRKSDVKGTLYQPMMKV